MTQYKKPKNTVANNPKITHMHSNYQDTYIPWRIPKTHTEFVRHGQNTHETKRIKKEGNGTRTKGSYGRSKYKGKGSYVGLSVRLNNSLIYLGSL